MSFRLAGRDLGQSFEVVAALADLARATPEGEQGRYAELLGVVHADDQDVSKDYVAAVRKQARERLSAGETAASMLSERARWLLERLSGEEVE